MTHVRVIPYDLFAEANLLKCYARIAVLAGYYQPGQIELRQTNDGPFEIRQNSYSGGIELFNVRCYINGTWYWLERQFSTRDCWSLKVTGTFADPEFKAIDVFDIYGEFSPAMQRLIHGKQ